MLTRSLTRTAGRLLFAVVVLIGGGFVASTNAAPAIVITPSGGAVSGQVGDVVNAQFTASGGTAPYTWAVSVGALPTGATISSSGLISGTLTASGVFTFTVRATDSLGATATTTFVDTIVPTIIVSPTTLSQLNVGTPVSVTFTATGGAGGFTFATSGPGLLPPGLSLSTAGVLSGTPTATGVSSFTVTATDSLGNVSNVNFLNTNVVPAGVPTMPQWMLVGMAALVAAIGYGGLAKARTARI